MRMFHTGTSFDGIPCSPLLDLVMRVLERSVVDIHFNMLLRIIVVYELRVKKLANVLIPRLLR